MTNLFTSLCLYFAVLINQFEDNKMKRFLIVFFYFFSISCNKPVENSHLNYPMTAKGDHLDVYHGHNVPDPYHWLEDDMSVETGACS